MDELFSQQNAHDIGAEVHNVLDLPEGLLCTLEKGRKVNTLDPVLLSARSHAQVNQASPKIRLWNILGTGSSFQFTCNRENRTRGACLSSSPLGGDVYIFSGLLGRFHPIDIINKGNQVAEQRQQQQEDAAQLIV